MAVTYPPEIEVQIERLTQAIQAENDLEAQYSPRWLAIQLLEGELGILNSIRHESSDDILAVLEECRSELQGVLEGDLDIAIADCRYGFVHNLVQGAVADDRGDAPTRSDRLDRLATHPWLGMPIFLGMMYFVFNIVQNVSAPFLDWINFLFSGPLTRWVIGLLTIIRAPDWLLSLAVDGVLAGVGGVLVFFPGLFAMYTLLALLEQSGYLARAAFVMDRFMSKVGLHGKSFIPMILGFGCNVPAIYATRTIEKREARLLTGLLIPFMSCTARLPVYIIFGLAFFPDNGNLVIFGLYLTGILVAAVVGALLSRLLFQGETLSILVMELPGYRLPNAKNVFNYAWSQSKEFVRKAGTLIVAFSVLLWALLNMPWGVTDPQDSYYGRVSAAIAPALAPAGFGTWQASGALVTGLVAKEVVVSTLAQVYHVPQPSEEAGSVSLLQDMGELAAGLWQAVVLAGQELFEVLTPGISLFSQETEVSGKEVALSGALQAAFTPLSAIAYLVFILLYVPCVATIGAQRQEFGWKWTALSVAITLVVPWMLAVTVFQVGRLLGLGG